MEKTLKLNDIPAQYYDIAEFMGVDKFVKFCDYFGGTHIYIPKVNTLVNIIRDKEIIDMYKSGISIKNISKKYNITQNRVRKIIKEVIQ